MAIQRTYSLPNCALMIEGISVGEGSTLSLLTNFECKFHHSQSHFGGGRKLLDSLVQAVSLYAQTIQKGEAMDVAIAAVSLEPMGEYLHSLQIEPSEDAVHQELLQIQLNTVQLFDLMDGLDQLCRDRDTLPDLSLSVETDVVAKARGATESKTLPIFTGIAGFAIAATAMFFVPVPQPKPQNQAFQPSNQTSQTSPKPLSQPTPLPPVISDKQLITKLESDLKQQIDKNWQTKPTFTEDLIYRVAVNEKSQIVGYRAMSAIVTVPEDELPLKKLRVIPTDLETGGSPTTPQPTITFYVTFKPNGIFVVERNKPAN
jgi:hypothetical protein